MFALYLFLFIQDTVHVNSDFLFVSLFWEMHFFFQRKGLVHCFEMSCFWCIVIVHFVHAFLHLLKVCTVMLFIKSMRLLWSMFFFDIIYNICILWDVSLSLTIYVSASSTSLKLICTKVLLTWRQNELRKAAKKRKFNFWYDWWKIC